MYSNRNVMRRPKIFNKQRSISCTSQTFLGECLLGVLLSPMFSSDNKTIQKRKSILDAPILAREHDMMIVSMQNQYAMNPTLICMLYYASAKYNHTTNVTNISSSQHHFFYSYDRLWYTFESKEDNHESHILYHKGGRWEIIITMNYEKWRKESMSQAHTIWSSSQSWIEGEKDEGMKDHNQ